MLGSWIDAILNDDLVAWLNGRQIFDTIVLATIFVTCLYLVPRLYDWWKQLKFSKTVLRDVYLALMLACVTIGFWAGSNLLNVVALDYTQPWITLPARLGFVIFVAILMRPVVRMHRRPMAKVSLEDELSMNPNMVLVVDDDEGQMKWMKRVITQRGYYPECFYSKAETIAFIQNLVEMPRLMFIDIKLKDGNGVDLAADIRRMGYKHPIIGMSGNFIDDPRSQKLFNETLLKPFRAPEFGAKVDYWIQR